MSRGRTNPQGSREGDVIDWWRVQRVVPNRMLLLRAELKLPGDAWLQFEVVPQSGERTLLRSRAWFQPRGLLGEIYWYGLLPIHGLLFSGMMRSIKQAAEAGPPALSALARAR